VRIGGESNGVILDVGHRDRSFAALHLVRAPAHTALGRF